MVPDDLKSKVTLEAISCAMQLHGLIMVEIKGKIATHDMHMSGAIPMWSKKLWVWGEAGVIAEDKDSKTGGLLVTSNVKVTVYICGTHAPQGL